MAIVKSADRVILILETISVRDNGITHGELSRISGIPKGSLSPLLSNLVDRDYLIFDASSKRYALGPKLMALSSTLPLDVSSGAHQPADHAGSRWGD